MFDRFVTHQARQRPTAPAVLTEAGVVTYAAFDRAIDGVAAALADFLGARPGPVAVALGDPYAEWLAILALARLGRASSPAHDQAASLRISDTTGQFGETTLIATPSWFASTTTAPVARGARPLPPRDQLARVVLTSGTTGASKRIGLTFGTLDAIIRNVPIAYGSTSDERWLAHTGAGTVLGFALCCGAWALGHAAILQPERRLGGGLFDRTRPTLVALAPHQLRGLLDELPPGFQPPRPLRLVTAGSALPPQLVRAAQSRLTEDIRSIYGASECSAVSVADAATLLRHAGAAGYVLPGVEVEIVDAMGRPMAAGEAGEVRIRSDRAVGGYMPAGEATRAFREGWFHPGDIGRFHDDGLLVIEGRVDDLMNIGGDKILPDLIERTALHSTGVRDAAAFSAPDRSGLECCWLAVVPGEGYDAARLETQLRSDLPWLGQLVWVTAEVIPRNGMGKIDRAVLRARAEAHRLPLGT